MNTLQQVREQFLRDKTLPDIRPELLEKVLDVLKVDEAELKEAVETAIANG